jgi:ElaB/YqjD/DUF883 family membrane-anchored ribosome-binding protein
MADSKRRVLVVKERQNNEIEGDAENTGQSVKEKVTEKMEAIREKAGEAVSKAGEAVSRIREGSLTDFYKDTKGYVRDYPGPSLLVALAVGYMLGVVFRRKR